MLDNLDRRILQLLESDSRRSKSDIARTLAINKAIVTYRVNRLQKTGVVTGYQYLTDQAKLGSTSFGLLLRFEGMLLAEQEQLLQRVQATKKFAWVALTNGPWDAIAVVVAPDAASFTALLDRFFEEFGTFIAEYKFYMDYEGLISDHTYLYQAEGDRSVPAMYSNSTQRVVLNELERQICKLFRVHPTMSLLRVAERLGKTYDTIQSHYKALVAQGVLLKCVPVINHELLGYKNTICLYNLRPKPDRMASLWQFCAEHPNIVRQARCLGNFNLVLNIHAQTDMELKAITSAINKEYADIINGCDFVYAADTRRSDLDIALRPAIPEL